MLEKAPSSKSVRYVSFVLCRHLLRATEGMNHMQGQNALEKEKLLVASVLKKGCDQVLTF